MSARVYWGYTAFRISTVKASMVWQILLIVAAGVPGAFLATVVYVALLLLIAKHFSGTLKVVVAMPVYVLYSVVMVAPLFYMLGQFRPEINASGLSMGIVALSWGVVVAPSMVYLGKYKIQELRNAGYFLPRR
ncbi:MAG: hypothetical protein KYX60_08625 [Halomonas meridiana]|uniref:hypothetical protein n=1 Tax=Vreelandella aquamarina TaxID=77097 RepID=UPI0024E27403|nr:hypothetical protein [Halomonas meridiana]MDK2750719.1 hypothetical protein [Halomonas meridiana]